MGPKMHSSPTYFFNCPVSPLIHLSGQNVLGRIREVSGAEQSDFGRGLVEILVVENDTVLERISGMIRLRIRSERVWNGQNKSSTRINQCQFFKFSVNFESQVGISLKFGQSTC